MIKKAFMRASIPFVLNGPSVFCKEFVQSATTRDWKQFYMQGDFLLKHIDTTLTKNVACFEKRFDAISFVATCKDTKDETTLHHYPFSVDCVQVYCFDTGLGICSINIPYATEIEKNILANLCAVLHCSAEQTNNTQGLMISHDSTQTYLSCVIQNFLDDLLGSDYVIYGTQDNAVQRRVDMFCAALCDIGENADAECNKLCYLLANAYDTRDSKLAIKKEDVFYQHDYIRWHFTKRGCACVSNLTGIGSNDNFLKNRWFYSIESNYFYLYIMVMHQKLASYHLLNSITADPDLNHFTINQKALIEFNAKYIFSIVSDEPFLQKAYTEMKKATNADDVYAELQSQLVRMFDYARMEADDANEMRSHRLNLISTFISIVCSISIISETVSLFRAYGYSLGFASLRNSIFTGVIGMEVLLFLALLLFVLIPHRKKHK